MNKNTGSNSPLHEDGDIHTRKSKGFQWRVLWDLFMVIIVLANLTLIVFDLTYLWLRPYYFENFPKITQIYDKPILGIEPHRATESYLSMVKELAYLEKLKNKEFLESEFRDSLEQLKNAIQEIEPGDAEKLASVRSDLLTELEKVQDPSQVGRRINELEEEILDLIPQKDKDSIAPRLESIERKFDLLVRVHKERGWLDESKDILARMDSQIVTIVETNPFRDSGQTERLETIKSYVKDRYDSVKTRSLDKEYRAILSQSMEGRKKFPSTAVAFTHFWRNSDMTMDEKLVIFQSDLEMEFALNYFRHVGKNGNPVNNYLWLDAPFLIFFFLEFTISWYLAVKRNTYLAWFLYPIYHWYDILGLIPVVEFRFFRLIRIYKIFLILKSSRFLPVGDDIVSRTIRYYSNIIKEEVTDMVTIQILSEAQEEIRAGSSVQILTNALDAHRADIKRVIIKKVKETASNDRLGSLIEEITAEIIEKVQSGLGPFGLLPEGFKNRLSREISQIIYKTASTAIVSTLNDDAGRKSMESLVDYLLDELEDTARDEEFNSLNTSITIELLENVKKSVARKKWLDTKI